MIPSAFYRGVTVYLAHGQTSHALRSAVDEVDEVDAVPYEVSDVTMRKQIHVCFYMPIILQIMLQLL